MPVLRPYHLFLGLMLLQAALFACQPRTLDSVDRLGLPLRPEASGGGKAIAKAVANLSLKDREDYFVSQVVAGNVPSNFRSLVPVKMTGKDRMGKSHSLTVWVTNDYLSVGSDKDALRIPLSPLGAQRIARITNSYLPTTKLVNEIYRRAEVKLRPLTMAPTREMTSTDYFVKHDRLIDTVLKQIKAKRTALIAGHKKDVVITEQLRDWPDRVAIYGWHLSKKRVIQPLSLVHGINYMDYSHGIRLVHRVTELDGKPYDLKTILRDENLSSLVSDEARFDSIAYPDTNTPTAMN